MRRLLSQASLLSLVGIVTATAPAAASRIAMEPEPVSFVLYDPGDPPAEQHKLDIDWTLGESEPGEAASTLVLEYDIRIYQGEGGGTVVFDVPILSVESSTVQMVLVPTGDAYSFHWEWSSSFCCAVSGLTLQWLGTFTLELAGIPTSGVFDVNPSTPADPIAVTYTVVPEPSAAWLVALGLGGLARRRRVGHRGLPPRSSRSRRSARR